MLAAIVAAFALAPLVAGRFTVSLLNDIGIAALVALGLVLLTGVGGATSFGQAAFVGIGAYATAWLTTAHGASPWLGLLFALALSGLSALVIGVITLRLGGHYLPLSTIAWGLSIAIVFGNLEALGRHSGIANVPALAIGRWSLADPRAAYYLVWALVGAALLFARNLLDSRPGRAMRGLRGGATLLASVGADAVRVRLALFVIAALLAGLAGWLYAHENRFVSPSPFDVRASIEYLLMAVAGGLGQLTGAIAGAAVVLLLKNALQDLLPLLSSRAAQIEAVVFALLFIGLLHFARAGLTGYVVRWWRRRHAPAPIDDASLAGAAPLPRRALPGRRNALARGRRRDQALRRPRRRQRRQLRRRRRRDRRPDRPERRRQVDDVQPPHLHAADDSRDGCASSAATSRGSRSRRSRAWAWRAPSSTSSSGRR